MLEGYKVADERARAERTKCETTVSTSTAACEEALWYSPLRILSMETAHREASAVHGITAIQTLDLCWSKDGADA